MVENQSGTIHREATETLELLYELLLLYCFLGSENFFQEGRALKKLVATKHEVSSQFPKWLLTQILSKNVTR